MQSSEKTDGMTGKCKGNSVDKINTKDFPRIINEIIGKLSDTSRFDNIISGKKNVIKIESKPTLQESVDSDNNALNEQYEKTANHLAPSVLDMADKVIGELYSEYTQQYSASNKEYKLKLGSTIENEALLYLEKHPRIDSEKLKVHLKSYMNQTFYDSLRSYIETWQTLSNKQENLSDSEYSELIQFTKKFLNIILQCNIISANVINIAGKKLQHSNKSTVIELISCINEIITNIKSLPEIRAEYILKHGFCKMPNPLNVINNAQVNDLNLLPLMRKVVDNLFSVYTNPQGTFSLPNGNTYTPKVINERAKSLINKYLSDSAKKFVENYDGEISNFEAALKSHLECYMMSCEYETLKNDIVKWKSFAAEHQNISDYYEFGNLKAETKRILSLFIENNICIVIDDSQIKTEADIEKLLGFYEISDAKELILHVNTIVDTIVQWKTLYQKLVEGDYKKNEINIITYSFDDIDTSLLFGTDVVRAYYEFKEIYTDSNLSEAAFIKRSNDIVNLLDEIKPQMESISKSMCRAFRVNFDRQIFEEKYTESKKIAQEEKITDERSWMPGSFTLKVNPAELYKAFMAAFDKIYYAWVCSNIK